MNTVGYWGRHTQSTIDNEILIYVRIILAIWRPGFSACDKEIPEEYIKVYGKINVVHKK